MSLDADYLRLANRSGVGRGDDLGVAGQPAGLDLRLRRAPGRLAVGQFTRVDQQFQLALRDVEADTVAIFDQGNRPSLCGFRGDVADTRPTGSAGEAPIGDQGD